MALQERVLDRLPPNNSEAEQSVLGSLLIDREAIVRVRPSLNPEDFYRGAHREIYAAIVDLYDKREPADLTTLPDELQRRGRLDDVGGLSYLTTLLSIVPTAAHVEYYAGIVKREATRRRLIDAGSTIVTIGYNDDLELVDALDKSEKLIFDVSQDRLERDFQPIAHFLDAFFERIDFVQQHRGELVGVPTGFADLDRMTGGLQQSDLIIVAARPGVGKSSLALTMASNAAENGKHIGIFSLEMSGEQLVQRLLAMDTGVDSQRLRLGYVDDDEWPAISRSLGKLASAPIYIDDTPAISIVELRSKARRLQAESGVDMIIVDYLQLMRGGRSDNRVQEVSEITRSLKELARELNVPLVALSQLSRAVESRAEKVPILSDLRESGSIEQDADIVMFIYREELYDSETEKKGIAEIHIAKHRNGPMGVINLRFFNSLTKFADLEVYREYEMGSGGTNALGPGGR